MARTPLTDESVEALIAGRSDGVPDDLADLATVLRAVRTSAERPSVPSADLVDLFAEGTEPQPEPAGTDERTPIGVRRRWLEVAFQRVAALGVAAKLGLVAIVGVAGVTTAGAAGALPDGLQDRVADAVGAVSPFEFPADERAEVGAEVSEDATGPHDPGVDGPEVADRVTPEDVTPGEPAAPIVPAHPQRGLDTAEETPRGEELPDEADDHPDGEQAPEDPPADPGTGDDHRDGAADDQVSDAAHDGPEDAPESFGHDRGDDHRPSVGHPSAEWGTAS